jgi:hypothetical protein
MTLVWVYVGLLVFGFGICPACLGQRKQVGLHDYVIGLAWLLIPFWLPVYMIYRDWPPEKRRNPDEE